MQYGASIRYWHTEWASKGVSRGTYRNADLNLKLSYPTLLRIVCGGNLLIPPVARFFKSLADIQLSDVTLYTAGFVTAVDENCNLNDIELSVSPLKGGGAFDFPRPPASGMFFRQFCNNLAQHPMLIEAVLAEGVSLRNLTVRRVRKSVAETEAEAKASQLSNPENMTGISGMTKQLARMFFLAD